MTRRMKKPGLLNSGAGFVGKALSSTRRCLIQQMFSLKCPVVSHWGCLAQTQRDEILRAAQERDKAEWLSNGSNGLAPARRPGLATNQTTEFVCGACMKGGVCMGCKEVALRPDQHNSTQPAPSNDSSSLPPLSPTASALQDNGTSSEELLFRCFTCKRLAHYAHLPVPDDYDADDTAEVASYYQYNTDWKCADCFALVYMLEHILAWRPFPENAIEPPRPPNEPPNHKAMLPREYLIKWADRSYRRVQWVPHGWLLAVAPNKLKHFLNGGPKIPLLDELISEEAVPSYSGEPSAFEIGREGSEASHRGKDKDVDTTSLLAACPDAEKRIPPAWKTVDRVLDIRLWRPRKTSKKGKQRATRVQSSGSDDEDPEMRRVRNAAYDQGEEPPNNMLVTIDEFESSTRAKLSERHIEQVAWAFIKWDDLGYDNGWLNLIKI